LMPSPAPAPVETADPLRIWFRFIRLNRRATNAVAAELKELGLSIPQFDLLSTLTEREGMSQQELAERLYMVEAELVERRSIPGDRRSNALYLTSKGRDLANRGIAAQRAYVMRTLGTLPAQDLADLERIVLAWRDRARAEEDAPSPKQR
jgi:MarR family transcriptional regulator, organic hydroperoxide resistance regulator